MFSAITHSEDSPRFKPQMVLGGWSRLQAAPHPLQLWNFLIKPVQFNGLLSDSAQQQLCNYRIYSCEYSTYRTLTDQPDSCLTHTVLLFSVVWLCTINGSDSVCVFPEWTCAALAPSARSRRFPVATSARQKTNNKKNYKKKQPNKILENLHVDEVH